MNHLSLIKELAQDYEKLSKTLMNIATEKNLSQMQKTEEQVAQTIDAVEDPARRNTTSGIDSVNKSGITIEQIRAVMAEKSQAGLTDKVKELLLSFGVTKLSGIKAQDYERLMEAAKALN